MRKSFALGICFVMLFAVAAHAEMKVAVFDVQVVAEKSDALKEAKDLWSKNYEKQKVQIEQERTAIERTAANMKKPTEAQQEALRKSSRAFTEKADAFVKQMQNVEIEIRQQMDVLIVQSANSYAASKGYNLILDSKSTPYYDKALDVSDDMLKEVNRVWAEAKAKNQQQPQTQQK